MSRLDAASQKLQDVSGVSIFFEFSRMFFFYFKLYKKGDFITLLFWIIDNCCDIKMIGLCVSVCCMQQPHIPIWRFPGKSLGLMQSSVFSSLILHSESSVLAASPSPPHFIH